MARVGCPDPACVKQGRESHEEEVRRVVSEDEASRWRWLREKRVLDQGETSAENLAFVLFCLHSHHLGTRPDHRALSHGPLPGSRTETE